MLAECELFTFKRVLVSCVNVAPCVEEGLEQMPLCRVLCFGFTWKFTKRILNRLVETFQKLKKTDLRHKNQTDLPKCSWKDDISKKDILCSLFTGKLCSAAQKLHEKRWSHVIKYYSKIHNSWQIFPKRAYRQMMLQGGGRNAA